MEKIGREETETVGEQGQPEPRRLYRDPWTVYTPHSELLRCLPFGIVEEEKVLPLHKSDAELTVAVVEPLGLLKRKELAILAGLPVCDELCSEAEWHTLLQAFRQAGSYRRSDQGATEDPDQLVRPIEAPADSGIGSVERGRAAPGPAGDDMGNLAQLIVANAWKRRASDIHLEPQTQAMLVRFRIDGQLQRFTALPSEQAEALIAHLKLRAQMDVAQKQQAQDGHLEIRIEDQTLNLRIATMPVFRGEKMVLRFLYRQFIELSLTELGMSEAIKQQFQRQITHPNGLFLVAGPTGAGKTSTLYAALNHLREESRHIISIEDPIEFELEGVNQIAVRPSQGLSFAQGLRGILRMDPDIIMIGEIRDRETADIALRAAITGRLVLSSIHTDDACGAIMRLLDMGIEPYLISSALIGVLNQRLLRLLCPLCAGDGERSSNYSAVSACPRCYGQRYHGRSGIFELLVLDETIREAIMTRPHLQQLRELAAMTGWQPLQQDALRLLQQGRTDRAELTRVLGLDESSYE